MLYGSSNVALTVLTMPMRSVASAMAVATTVGSRVWPGACASLRWDWARKSPRKMKSSLPRSAVRA
jgi:hypothetical protein